jgi:hypothetical protein
MNTRDPVSLAGRDTNYRNTPSAGKGQALMHMLLLLLLVCCVTAAADEHA